MHSVEWYWYCGKFVIRNKVFKRISRKQIWPFYKRRFININDASDRIIEMIESGKPFMAARIGFTEMAMMKAYEFGRKDKYAICTQNMCDMSGFFPNDPALGEKFLECMREAIPEVDLFGVLNSPLEDYFIRKYTKKDTIISPFSVYDFWKLEKSWTEALVGKKVLLVHPFTKSIENQYAKREKIFTKHPEYLPEFTLITYQAIQTAGGNTDSRFENWFEALEFMKKEIREIDFDLAIVACGAYAFPLAADIKKSGRQVILMAGVSQILFGIKGQRWTKKNSSVLELMNDDWVWPLDEEVPVDSERIEGGPYFRPTESYQKRIENSKE